jgi:hypothetical protein
MRIPIRSGLCAALVLLGTLLGSAPAQAENGFEAPQGVGWAAYSEAYPTNLAPGGRGIIAANFVNTGADSSAGSITVTDVLPAGFTVVKVGPFTEGGGRILSEEGQENNFGGIRWSCGETTVSGATVITCTSNPEYLATIPYRLPETGKMRLLERIGIEVEAPDTQGTFANKVTVNGGGAPSSTSTVSHVTVSSSEASFGVSEYNQWFTNADGTIDTQAGSHPYKSTFVIGFNEDAPTPASEGQYTAAGGNLRHLKVKLPQGLFANAKALPQCSRGAFLGELCPPQSQVGTLEVLRMNAKEFATRWAPQLEDFPIYNMVPPAGAPAMFASPIAGYNTFFVARVGAANGYAIEQDLNDLPNANVIGSVVTIWGAAGEASHNEERTTESQTEGNCKEGCASSIPQVPFLTLPTTCQGPQTFTAEMLTSWSDPNVTPAVAKSVTHDDNDVPVGFTGCEALNVDPQLSLAPDTSFADTPAGLGVNVEVPQETLDVNNGVVQATIKDTTVTLPEGVVVNPGQAVGLQACGEAEANVHGEGPQTCPAASRVGTVKIVTPLLEGEVEPELAGNVYVLQSEPPHLRLLLTASGDGIYLKVVGNVELNEATGQLTTTFDETPALPFTHLTLSFSGGAQAALATPTHCGAYTSTSDFTPWSTPFAADLFPTSSFQILSGSGGSACPSSPLPFSPSLIAGSTTDQAGGFTDFSLLLQRGDDQQRIDGLQFKAPEGLTGLLAKVPLCTNAQAEANECPEASKIGHTVVQSGPGPYPLVVPEPGQPPAPIYLTESYGGAPFGLSVVVPLHVGPFTLPTQRVRAKIEVNPITSALTVTTNPLPQEVGGVPTDLREVDAVIERPEFMINPTDCAPQEFTGTAYGTAPPGVNEPSESAAIGSHFQMGSCRSLEFHPQLGVSASSKSSRANGTSVSFKLTYPKGAIGRESWLKGLKVDLPKQLPARLTTLQKSCVAATFNANPAACPSAARIGTAKVRTQLLPVPLEGPVYFVSNGGAKFPEAVFALQGDGVTVDIHAETFINEKTGVTSATFRTIPDDPFEEATVTLPSGPYSEFTGIGNLCKGALKMPTAFVGQNGAEIHQNTSISVTGCPKAKKEKKKGKHKKKKSKAKAKAKK